MGEDINSLVLRPAMLLLFLIIIVFLFRIIIPSSTPSQKQEKFGSAADTLTFPPQRVFLEAPTNTTMASSSSSSTPTIPAERNLPVVIQFTRTSPSYTPTARLAALRSLVQRITRARAGAISARADAMRTLEQGHRYTEQLGGMRGLPSDTARVFGGMTTRVVAEKRIEVGKIEREISALDECLREAEMGGKFFF